MQRNWYAFFLVMFTGLLQAQSVVDSLEEELKTANDTSRVIILTDIGRELLRSDPGRSFKVLTQALSEAKLADYEKGEAISSRLLGSYYSNRDEFDKAISYYQAALAIYRKSNNKRGIAAIMGSLSNVYMSKGDLAASLKLQQEALTMFEETGDRFGIARSLANIGNLYYQQDIFSKALDYYQRSLEVSKEAGDEQQVQNCCLNIGSAYLNLKDYDKSLEYYQQAYDLSVKRDDKSISGLVLGSIGDIYKNKKEYNKADDYFSRSLALAKEMEDRSSIVGALLDIGELRRLQGKYDESLIVLKRALDVARLTNSYEDLADIYFELSEAYAGKKQFDKAFESQQQFIAYRDSFLSAERSKQLLEMQSRYENERKEKEIVLLKKDTEIQQLQINKSRMWMIVLAASALLILSLGALAYNRYLLKKKANMLLEQQNEEIKQQKEEITDSINYAKRIQESILPPDSHVKKILPDSFIFYRPKDIVSGDFYWVEQHGDVALFAAVDCTGHGVPGALMSVVGLNLLHQAVKEKGLTCPAEVLGHLDYGVNLMLRQSESGSSVKDGMDLAMCAFEPTTMKLQYAGVFNSMYVIRKTEAGPVFTEVKADKFPIGVNADGKVDVYTNHEIQLSKGDTVYLYSDGYADQFGGPAGKKFMYKRLRELLVSINDQTMDEQNALLGKAFDEWKGNLEQIDDVLVMGMRV